MLILGLFFFLLHYCSADPIQIVDRRNKAIEILYQVTGYEGPYTINCLRWFNDKPFICKVDYAERSWIIRFNGDDSDVIRAQEVALHHYAHKHGFGPEILYANQDEGIIIMEYFDPSIENQISLSVEQRIESLASCIKKIHSCELICQAQENFISRSLKRLSLWRINHRTTQLRFDALYELLVFLEGCIDWTVKSVFVHGDLHKFNLFLCRGIYKAIDFETANYDHPYVDLARAAVFFAFNEKEEAYLLQRYWSRGVTLHDLQQFAIFKLFNTTALALWFLGTLPDDFCENSAFQKMFYVKPLKKYLEDPLFSDLTECYKESNQEWRYCAALAALKEAERLIGYLQNTFAFAAKA